MNTLFADLRLAFRSLWRTPGLFATTVLLLAVGIGATTALYSVVNTVLLTPLPYKEPERLVRIWTELPARGVAHAPESPTNLEDFRRGTALFEDIAGVITGNSTIRQSGGTPRFVQSATGTWNFLSVLGVEPMLGRGFTETDGAFSAGDVPATASFPGTAYALPRTGLISYGLWQSEFGGRADVVGKLFEINGFPVEVVGVMPRQMRLHMGPAAGVAPDIDVWMPSRVDLAVAPRNNSFLHMVGRLRAGVGIEQARAEISALAERLYEENLDMRAAGAIKRLAPYTEEVTADVRPGIWALLGAAVLVMLIACANVANLLLVRASARSREFAVRLSLGASRAHLIRQMLAESLLLALLGALGGVLLAKLGLSLLLADAPANIARLDAVQLDVSVLAFAIVTAVLASVLVGLIPALRGSRLAAADGLRERGSSGLQGSRNVRAVLVTAEIALSFVLLIGAGLMMRSFMVLQQAELGFDPDQVLVFQVNLPPLSYPEAEQRRQFYYGFQERIARLPGVQAVSAARPLPLSGMPSQGRYATEQPLGEDAAYLQAHYRVILPGYFEAMHTPLLAGRHLTADDEIAQRPYVVVDDVLAQRAWPGQDPIGRKIWLPLGQSAPVPLEVVGVVRRQLQDSLHETPRESLYFTAAATGQFGVNSWVVRTTAAPDAAVAMIRQELPAMDPSLPLVRVRTMESLVDAAKARTRFALNLIGAFGVAALLIAAVGLYAAIHHLVRLRRAEIGVRMSFGARRRDVFGLFVGHGLMLAGIGIVTGLIAALALSRLLGGLLVNVAPTDPATYAAIAALFLLITALASALPALRATRLSPMTVLRDEG